MSPLRRLSLLLLFLSMAPHQLCAARAAAEPGPAAEDWTTWFEATGGRQTPRYEETVAYCRRLADASSQLVYASFGTSPQGRELPLLIANRRGRFTPEEARADDGVVLLVQACIHAGECCGKDAGLMLLRDLTVGGRRPGLPDHVTVLFIPIFNVDGHERFGPYNRPNQNGPEQMGWRANAQNLNLNRDFLKADAPEMQAWLRLWTAWLPDFLVDIHSTDGADYQYPITYSLETRGNLDPDLTGWIRERYLPRLERAMADAGFPIQNYCIFRRGHDPRSGLESWVSPPRFSQGYAAVQNRPGLLIEAHMMKPYPVRVEGTRAMLAQTLELLGEDHRALRRLTAAADERAAAAAFGEAPFALAYEVSDQDSTMIDFLGVEYDLLPSELTGGKRIVFHGDRPATFRIPFFDKQIPTVSVRLPEAWLVPPEWGEVIARLQLHGVRVRRLAAPETLTVRGCRFGDAEFSRTPYENRQTVSFSQQEITETRPWPAGTAVVDRRQRAARVAAHLLQPEGPDSYVFWGFFNQVFNRTEYIESYVIEELARRMLAEDPALAAEFAAAKAADPEFAADPRAIYSWFHRRTPYYDDRHNVYPVGMIDDRGVLDGLRLQ